MSERTSLTIHGAPCVPGKPSQPSCSGAARSANTPGRAERVGPPRSIAI